MNDPSDPRDRSRPSPGRGPRPADRGPRPADRGPRPTDRDQRPRGDFGRRERSAPQPPTSELLAGRRLILGQQAVREAIRSTSTQVHEVLIEERPSPRAEAVERFARDQGLAIRHVPRAELERLGGGTLHQGVAALADPLRLLDANDLLLDPELLALALDGVVDPQNFGAAVRSATGLCHAPILWPENASAPLTPATFRASAGAIEHAKLCRVPSLSGVLSQAAASGIEVVGLAPEATSYLHELDLTRPTIVVIGSEQKGMGRGVRKACTQLARLAGTGAVQSLNASVAAGIALHTAVVQRATAKK